MGLLSGLREQLEGAASVGPNHIDLIHYDTQADLEAYEGDQTDIAILLAPVQESDPDWPLVLDICGEQMAANDAVDLLVSRKINIDNFNAVTVNLEDINSIFENNLGFSSLVFM